MFNFLKKLLILTALIISLSPLSLLAQSTNTAPTPTQPPKKFITNLQTFSENAGFSKSQTEKDSVAKTIGRVASIVISFVGIIFIIINVYSGIQWMTAGGNTKKIDEARARIIHATGGLILLALSFILTNLVTSVLGK